MAKSHHSSAKYARTSNMSSKKYPPPAVMGTEDIMKPKQYGTSAVPCQKDLRWGCDYDTANRICNYNRHYAEHSGYFEKTTFRKECDSTGEDETPASRCSWLLAVEPCLSSCWNPRCTAGRVFGTKKVSDSDFSSGMQQKRIDLYFIVV